MAAGRYAFEVTAGNGHFRSPPARVEVFVTSGGALAEAVTALREAGLVVRNAVCVVDREEGGADALARLGVRLRSLYRAGDLVPAATTAENPHG